MEDYRKQMKRRTKEKLKDLGGYLLYFAGMATSFYVLTMAIFSTNLFYKGLGLTMIVLKYLFQLKSDFHYCEV